MIKKLSDYLSVAIIMTATKAVTTKTPTPEYTAVKSTAGFGAAVRRNTCMCITVSAIKYQLW